MLFPYVWQQLSAKSHVMEIEDLASYVQALEFTNEEERQAHQQAITDRDNQIQAHQQAIEEKDATIAMLNDDLQKRGYENMALQASG